ncbi:hypothetical protein BpHYR1_013928 [Brachionus plicatilis]|uniref:Uncharacterized protein n=1 Tax=Brachionus plicatilis TaxID=10195 RepID=A0A3M7R4E3_BRAPC|nr:hypothetical protein BpHYR1_013928 [Brachionus plicatilis]
MLDKERMMKKLYEKEFLRILNRVLDLIALINDGMQIRDLTVSFLSSQVSMIARQQTLTCYIYSCQEVKQTQHDSSSTNIDLLYLHMSGKIIDTAQKSFPLHIQNKKEELEGLSKNQHLPNHKKYTLYLLALIMIDKKMKFTRCYIKTKSGSSSWKNPLTNTITI